MSSELQLGALTFRVVYGNVGADFIGVVADGQEMLLDADSAYWLYATLHTFWQTSVVPAARWTGVRYQSILVLEAYGTDRFCLSMEPVDPESRSASWPDLPKCIGYMSDAARFVLWFNKHEPGLSLATYEVNWYV